jgi:hypothetical protein
MAVYDHNYLYMYLLRLGPLSNLLGDSCDLRGVVEGTAGLHSHRHFYGLSDFSFPKALDGSSLAISSSDTPCSLSSLGCRILPSLFASACWLLRRSAVRMNSVAPVASRGHATQHLLGHALFARERERERERT